MRFIHSSTKEGSDVTAQKTKTIGRMGELAWLLGVLLCSLGVCFSARSGFGVSMVVAPAYVLHRFLSPDIPWMTFGAAEYLLQGVLILLLCVAVQRFKWKYLLSFFTAVCYGFALDFWRMLFGTDVYPELWQRVVACAAGALITAFAIALYLHTYLPQQGYELVVKELTERYRFRLGRVKWLYDISSLLIAILLMLALFRSFSTDMVGVGTLLLTVVNTPLITLSGRLLDRFFTFDPAFPRFRARFDQYCN